MEQDTAGQIEQRLSELPEDVRAAVLSVEWEQKVQTIAQKHALHIDQSGALGDTTLMAMLGFFDMADFASHITEEVGVSAETASAIAAEINTEVFMSIRDSLRKFTETTAKSALQKSAEAEPAQEPVAKSAPQQINPDLSAAESMLQAKTASILPATTSVVTPAPAAPLPTVRQEPPKPQNYTADPYREPPM